MSMAYYNLKDDIPKSNSLNDYSYIFEEYKTKNLTLEESLKEMYSSIKLTRAQVEALTNDILDKSREILSKNYDYINEKYPLLTPEEIQIISSYNGMPYAPDFSPYKILNDTLCGENRRNGIIGISKYLYIFLNALRKLDRYFLKPNEYLYKAIDKFVFLDNNINGRRIVYKKNMIKVFWGFTSFSSVLKKNYYIGDKNIDVKKGTIFSLYGNIYGYDISLFNLNMDDQIILEPEQKCIIINAIPYNSSTNFINIRLKSKDYNNLLPNIFTYGINGNFDNSRLIKIVYKIPYMYYQKNIRIFGHKFVKNNEKYCTIIYKGKEYKLATHFTVNDILVDKLEIYLKGFNEVSNLNQMFANCKFLYSCDLIIGPKILSLRKMFKNCKSTFSLTNINKWNTSNIKDMSYMFSECSNLESLPDISNFDTSNVRYINHIFSECFNLKKLPDISKWNTSKMINMSYAFFKCRSLKVLPHISKWDLSKVIDIKFMFYGCYSLNSLPDISLWNISKVKDMIYLFAGCSFLSELPDVSNWNISNIDNLNSLFYNCSNLLYLPDISKWNLRKVTTISNIFDGCSKLKKLPDISRWNTSNIKSMDYVFNNCSSLLLMPDISKWKTSKVVYINSIFKNCSSLTALPDISNWNTSNIQEMDSIFEDCTSLLCLPDISKWNISQVTSINNIFRNCANLSVLPKISKWKTSKILYMENVFYGCSSLASIPDISNWDISNVKKIKNMFKDCITLSFYPDISGNNNFPKYDKNNFKNVINCVYYN